MLLKLPASGNFRMDLKRAGSPIKRWSGWQPIIIPILQSKSMVRPLSEVEPDAKNIIIQPEGFQVIEELIFPTYDAS
jgi:hypothetical protein